MNKSIFLFSIIPGWAHIILGLYWKGLLIFITSIMLLALSIIDIRIYQYEVRYFTVVVLVVLWFSSILEITKFYNIHNSEKFLRAKKQTFMDFIEVIINAKNSAGNREENYKELLRMIRTAGKRYRYDPDFHYLCGIIFWTQEDKERYKKELKRCIKYDFAQKWQKHVVNELYSE